MSIPTFTRLPIALLTVSLLVSLAHSSTTSKQCVFTEGAIDPSMDGFRTFEIENKCDGELLVNFQGQTFTNGGDTAMLPEDGGMRLAARSTKNVSVSERTFSMRVWARQNCTIHKQPVQGAGLMWCDAGNCPIPGGGDEVTCRGPGGQQIGGAPPSSVIELTLCGGRGGRSECYGAQGKNCSINGWEFPLADYYDVSSVDGPTLGVSIEPVNFQKVNNSGLDPRFNCQPASMKQLNYSDCPAMLRMGADGANYAPVERTTGCISPCAFSAQFQEQWKALFNNDTSKAMYEQAHVCCECGQGRGSCEDNCAPKCSKALNPNAKPNLACIAGCSANAGYPDSFAPTFCFLKDYPTVTDPRSGEQVDLSSVPKIFKQQNPLAYSWQFDDLSSTFQCMYADYKVTFCAGGSPTPPAPPMPPTPTPPAPPTPTPPTPPTPTPPTPPTPTPPAPPKCTPGQSVPCPGGAPMCSGNSCCPDGSTCPSADEHFTGCPKPKTVDCLPKA